MDCSSGASAFLQMDLNTPLNSIVWRLVRQATELTSAGNLNAATAAMQRALGAGLWPPSAASDLAPAPTAASSLAQILAGYVARRPASGSTSSALSEGEFLSGFHRFAGLTRAYKLYVPPGAADRPMPLVVMLHGCNQNPDDFAAGTGMNTLAQELGVLVLYPAQSQGANPARCWNWFKHNHQGRNGGEAALIANMAKVVAAQRAADSGRIYIAGLSAGGAMAALVAAAHPDVFAAVGVHSGLAPGAAKSLPQGLAAMRSGAAAVGGASLSRATLPVPTIVFHGDQDTTVHPMNGDQVMAAALAGNSQRDIVGASAVLLKKGVSTGGRNYSHTVYGSLPAVGELWVLHGAGHAWSGGHASGSYTDPIGPDASREMLRFFLSQAASRVD